MTYTAPPMVLIRAKIRFCQRYMRLPVNQQYMKLADNTSDLPAFQYSGVWWSVVLCFPVCQSEDCEYRWQSDAFFAVTYVIITHIAHTRLFIFTSDGVSGVQPWNVIIDRGLIASSPH